MWRRGFFALNVVAAVLIGLTGAAAQTWPSKPIRIIIPFTAGSGTDMVARTVAEQLSAQLGQPIVVENRVGAGGTLGVGAVAKAYPDGHTILVHSTTQWSRRRPIRIRSTTSRATSPG